MRRAIIAVALFAVALGAGFTFHVHRKAKPFEWCHSGEQAVVVGSGREADGSYLVTYGCERVAKK